MKGIILAGGTGSRLYPATISISKQLLPIYDKPMVYYPLSTLMLAGIQDILIISSPEALPQYKAHFHDGRHLGLNITYQEQHKPEGIAQAFILGEKFIANDKVMLILGDNIFYGHNLDEVIKSKVESIEYTSGAHIFGYYVNQPERYGVAEVDEKSNVISIEEKPKNPKSNFAVTGLYIYDNDVIEIAKSLKPSKRGELEITDINNAYLAANKLTMTTLSRGYAWLDTGTHESYLDASHFIATIERRQGLKIGCIEEIALKQGYISKEQFINIVNKLKNNSYGNYLARILDAESQTCQSNSELEMV